MNDDRTSAIEILESIPGDTSTVHGSLGVVFENAREFRKAAEHLAKAIELLARSPTASSLDLARLLWAMGRVMIASCEVTLARTYLEAARDHISTSHSSAKPEEACILSALGSVYTYLGHIEEAGHTLRAAWDAFRSSFGTEQHYEVALCTADWARTPL